MIKLQSKQVRKNFIKFPRRITNQTREWHRWRRRILGIKMYNKGVRIYLLTVYCFYSPTLRGFLRTINLSSWHCNCETAIFRITLFFINNQSNHQSHRLIKINWFIEKVFLEFSFIILIHQSTFYNTYNIAVATTRLPIIQQQLDFKNISLTIVHPPRKTIPQNRQKNSRCI